MHSGHQVRRKGQLASVQQKDGQCAVLAPLLVGNHECMQLAVGHSSDDYACAAIKLAVTTSGT